MNLAPMESFATPVQVMLSTRLVSELGDPHSMLRATIQRSGSALIIRAGGEIDASNEHIWRRLLGEAAAVATSPGMFVVDISGLDFTGCCTFAALADAADWCRSRGVGLRLVSSNRMAVRIIKACELDTVLPVYPTTDSALSPAVA
jgi:anti-anti-sigma factor